MPRRLPVCLAGIGPEIRPGQEDGVEHRVVDRLDRPEPCTSKRFQAPPALAGEGRVRGPGPASRPGRGIEPCEPDSERLRAQRHWPPRSEPSSFRLRYGLPFDSLQINFHERNPRCWGSDFPQGPFRSPASWKFLPSPSGKRCPEAADENRSPGPFSSSPSLRATTWLAQRGRIAPRRYPCWRVSGGNRNRARRRRPWRA